MLTYVCQRRDKAEDTGDLAFWTCPLSAASVVLIKTVTLRKNRNKCVLKLKDAKTNIQCKFVVEQKEKPAK